MSGRGRPQRHHRPRPRRGAAVVRQALRLPPFINDYRAYIDAPANGGSVNDTLQDLTVIAQSRSGLPMDVQVEWRRQQAFELSPNYWEPVPVYTVDQANVDSDVETPSPPPTALAYGTWWVRVRAGHKATNTWSAWSPQSWFDVRPVLGSWTQYLDVNVGTVDPPMLNTFVYVDMNIGVPPRPLESADLMRYVDMNIGVRPRPMGLTAYSDMNVGPKFNPYVAMAYTDLNVDPTVTPTPHIWWIRPEKGKEGYVFNIYGQGFGAQQNEYNGSVVLGNLVCETTRWEMIPPQLTATTVSVSGTPRPATSQTQLPGVQLNAGSIVVAAGDIIEYDLRWDGPVGQVSDIYPSFTISGTAYMPGYNIFTLSDVDGVAWNAAPALVDGEWHHRKFVVPAGHTFVGRTLSDFRFSWYGFAPGSGNRRASLRSMVIRSADGTPKMWATGDDHISAPTLTYVANTGILQYATFEQEGFEIVKGQGVDPDKITPEHGWIVAVVPSGAVSSMVQVVLEE